NGTRDTTFGDQGVVYFTEIEDPTEGIGIKVLPNGKTLVGISSFYGKNFYIAQLLPGGVRDSTFGVNGVYKHLNKDFRARTMTLTANMLTVSGREESNSSYNKILLLRFLLDLSVGTFNPENAADPTLWIYPNPISEQFTLEFGLTQQAQVSVQLFDLQGKLVQSLVQNQSFEQGEHALGLHCPGHLPAGNYILTLEVASKKMTSVQVVKK
ncbi:MAG: T9SS type A sorting domain-containing protein, partial [Saprospiraceae bacterium]|nr:T9SS type A sorting domain-containing protein [Saprospiraceae bacterium]